jgi:hypothetical protein
MKNGILLLSAITILIALYGCKPEEKECFDDPIEIVEETTTHDSILAKKLGADEYGMKST